MKQNLHTPEGVRDIYNEECERKLYLEQKLFSVLTGYGYHPIETPSFEYFDIFGQEVGTTPSKDLYKFFDREGNTLVLRPDITPSIARSAAKYYTEDEMPLRFCYKGNTFINHHSLRGRMKECTQLGAELMGDNTVDADAEVLSMIVDCLQAAGLKEFQISVGHASIFKGLVEAAGFTVEETDELRDLISNKNFYGVEEFVENRQLPENLKQCFGILRCMYTSAEELETFKQAARPFETVYAALQRLEQLQELLLLYGIDKYVSFEPGMVSEYHYYTGILLAGYTYGTGEPIVKGGRYDELLPLFGKKAAAIGFVVVIDQLLEAIMRQNIEVPITYHTQLIIYTKEHREDAVVLARKARSTGGKAELLRYDEAKGKDAFEAYAKRNHIARITWLI
ncbi:MAG: ATP phosphoribosyltransferase regulatory subunit [Eubacterium sp.]|nr:ATP phosphoribosyltransferase regulatory subunit [Eubacterium sp.]